MLSIRTNTPYFIILLTSLTFRCPIVEVRDYTPLHSKKIHEMIFLKIKSNFKPQLGTTSSHLAREDSVLFNFSHQTLTAKYKWMQIIDVHESSCIPNIVVLIIFFCLLLVQLPHAIIMFKHVVTTITLLKNRLNGHVLEEGCPTKPLHIAVFYFFTGSKQSMNVCAPIFYSNPCWTKWAGL